MMRIDDVLRALAALPLAETQASALAAAGETLAAAVREVLSGQPGGVHEAPWMETGRLHDSIGFDVDGDMLSVGSVDPAAEFQERGTRAVPARPFLGPTGLALGERVAEEIGARFAVLLKLER